VRPHDPIVVTGCGALTSVGNDAVQTASAIRAGIQRFSAWAFMGTAFDGELAVNASTLPRRLGNAPWLHKAYELSRQPVYEALWQARVFDGESLRRSSRPRRIGGYLGVPYRDRPGVELGAYEAFVAEARRECMGPLSVDAFEVCAADHVAGATAIRRAAEDLHAGEVDCAIVVAVDSLLHSQYLDELLMAGRLKCPEVASGLIPGEAGAALVLERVDDAVARGVSPLARLGAASLEQDEPLALSTRVTASGASRAVALALVQAHAPVDVVISDLNGERWRSLEWSLVETRSLAELPHGWELWHPAENIGDVGAATGVLHVVIALRAFARGYAGQGGILLTSAADRGERSAMTVLPAGDA
jgi:3-oxoacyl-[acyl-carrier-protein] synthase I